MDTELKSYMLGEHSRHHTLVKVREQRQPRLLMRVARLFILKACVGEPKARSSSLGRKLNRHNRFGSLRSQASLSSLRSYTILAYLQHCTKNFSDLALLHDKVLSESAPGC